MKTMDVDSLRVLCVLRGKRGFVFFQTFSASVSSRGQGSPENGTGVNTYAC
jgi:hypothetical protein